MVHLTLVMKNTKSILYGQGNTIPDDLRLERALDALQSVHNIGRNMYSWSSSELRDNFLSLLKEKYHGNMPTFEAEVCGQI